MAHTSDTYISSKNLELYVSTDEIPNKFSFSYKFGAAIVLGLSRECKANLSDDKIECVLQETDMHNRNLLLQTMKLLSMPNAYIHIDDAWLKKSSEYVSKCSLGECARDIVSVLISNATYRVTHNLPWNKQNPGKYMLDKGQAVHYYDSLGEWASRTDRDYTRVQQTIRL